MSCQITYNKQGNIARVNTPSGVESPLFRQIAKLPIAEYNLEKALDTYKQTYSEKLDINREQEPDLVFESDSGESFTDLRSAMKDSKREVNIGVKDNSGNIKNLLSLNTTADLDSVQGKINYMIKSNIMSTEKVIENGKTYFKSQGTDQVKQIVNDEFVKEILPSITVHKDGRIELLEKFTEKTDIDKAIESALTLKNPMEPVLTEDDLKARLEEFLVSVGVETTSIENYKKKYKVKNGVDPSAEALADISNQVIAFREGSLTLDNLTEETMHFVVEGWNASEISDLLEDVASTDTYLQHAETYRDIYTRENPEMSAEEVEELVRKEILGKELSKSVIEKTNKNVLDRIVDWFNRIFLPSGYQARLQDISEKVYDALVNRDLNNYVDSSGFKAKKFKMYNTSVNQSYKNLANALIEQEKHLRKVGRGSKRNLEKLHDSFNTKIQKTALQEMSSLAKREANYLKGAMLESSKKSTTLTPEQLMVYQNLTSNIRPALSGLIASIENNKDFKNEVKDLKDLSSFISNEVEGLFRNTEDSVLENAVERIMKKNRIGDGIFDDQGNIVPMSVVKVQYDKSGFQGTFDEYLKDKETVKDRIKLGIKTVGKDTSAFYSYFGQITHASDPLLNVLGNIISDMKTEQEHEFINRMKDFQKELRDKGYTSEDLSKLVQEDGYVVSEWDFVEYETFKDFSKVKAYADNYQKIEDNLLKRIDLEKDASKKEDLEKELQEHKDFLEKINKADFKNKDVDVKGLSDFPVITSDIVRSVISSDIQININKGTETFLNEDYAEKRKTEFDKLGVSDVTRARMRFFSELRGQLKRSMSTSVSGTPMYTNQNKTDLEYINSERRKSMSVMDADGNIKNGLKISDIQEPGFIKHSEGVYIALSDKASEEAIIAYDMTNIRQNGLQNIATQVFSRQNNVKFFEDLEAMENDPEMSREDVLDWFYLNTNIGFSEDFFKDSENQFKDMFEEIDGMDNDIDLYIEEYKTLMSKRKAVIDVYKSNLNVTSSSMTEDSKQKVRDITDEMDSIMSMITAFAKGAGIKMFDDSTKEDFAKTSANKSFFDALDDQGLTEIDDKLDFMMKNMSSKNRTQIQGMLSGIENGNLTIGQQIALDDYGYTKESVYRYAETKMLPYYSTYMPIGLSYFYQDKITPISKLVDNLSNDPDVRLSVSFDYMDASLNPNEINKNRRLDFKGGMQQPSLTKKPEILGRKFDFENKNWSKLDSKSKSLQDIWTNFNYESLESYGEEGYRNVYLAPQVSKSKIDAISEAYKGKNIGSNIKDWLNSAKQYRADENIQGENINGESLFAQGVRVIPKPHLNKISDPVSSDLFRTSAILAQQAALYKARVKYSKEMLAVESAMLNRTNVGGKEVQASNSYSMMKSYIDNNLFGIREQQVYRTSLPILGVVDVSKVLKTVHSYVRGVSLMVTPIVPLTSAVTAHTQLLTERWVGQYIDNDSANKGTKEFLKIGKDGFTEALEIDSLSKMSALGEHFQIFDLLNRFDNSSHSKALRTVGRIGYGLHTAGNYTPLSTALLGQLHANRIYNGYVLDKNEYDQLTAAEGKDKKVANLDWKNLKTIYDYIETKDGKVSYSKELENVLGLDEQGIKDLDFALINKVKKVVERIDGQIKDEERTMAQRHFLLQYVMTNKGWMSIAISNRFKSGHVNLQTGQWEEGSYTSLFKYTGKVFEKLIKNKDPKAFQKEWASASEVERGNLKRVAKEVATLGAVFYLKILLCGFADDDEDSYLKQSVAYLSQRLVNETSSAQFGLVGELKSSVESPIVGLKHLYDMGKFWNGFNFVSPDTIKSGRYAGLDKFQRYWIKAIPGFKPAYDLWSAKNLKSQRDSYDFFSKENEVYNIFSWFVSEED